MGRFNRWSYGVLAFVLGVMVVGGIARAEYLEEPARWTQHYGGVSVATYEGALSTAKGIWDNNNLSHVSCRVWTFAGWNGSGRYSYWLSGCAGGGVDTYPVCPSGYTFDHDMGDICYTGEPPVLDCAPQSGVVIERWTEQGIGTLNVAGCAFEGSGVGLCVPHLAEWQCYSKYTGSGLVYDAGGGQPEILPESEEPCVAGDNGYKVCGNPENLNCGKFNGHSYCVSQQDVPVCKDTAGNTVICHMNPDGTPPPDAPTTDFGTPVPASETWDHTGSDLTVHHMGGWGGGAEGTEPGPGGGTPGEVGGSAASTVEGDTDGDGECDAGEDCLGGGPELGEHPALPSSDVGWIDWSSGFGGTGSCPAPQNITLPGVFGGGVLQLSYEPFCDFASMIRPLLLAAAYLMAAFIVIRGL